MPGRAVQPSRARAGITQRERNMRSNLLMILPLLNEDTAMIQNLAGLRQIAVVNRGVAHVIPGPGLNNPPAPNIVPLQIDEQADVQAMRAVLKLLILDNNITTQHFWMALTKLSAMLPTHGPYRIPELQREYARILRRMARVMTPWPSTGNDQYDDETTMAELVQDLAVECPLELRECLDKLLEAINVAFSLRGGRGVDGDGVVFVAVKDREAFASALCSLAARLERPLS